VSGLKTPSQPAEHRNIYLTLTVVVQVILVVGLVLLLWRQDWENVFLTVLVIALTWVPALLGRYRILLPPEFQFIAVLFVFLSLFLGSVSDLYYRLWWWDIVLHTASGFLLGIVGFLALFLLNQTEQLPQGMKREFLCFFAVTFAVTLGVLWEIFEYAVDRIAPAINMQSTETGVVDTMHDLIVDTVGAVIVALMGWAYIKTGRYSFVADGVRGFIALNPRLFRRSAAGQDESKEAG
jgi:hypothetical protein